MANLDESSTFEDYIYQIELTDYIEGGSDGIHNLPLKQLTNRTRWLYDRMQYITDNYRYILPTASRSVLGGIKVGAGLSIDSDGVLRAVLPTTTTTTTTVAPVTVAPTTTTTTARPTTTAMPVTSAPVLDVPRIVSMTRSAPTATGVTITCVTSSPAMSDMSRVSNIVVWWSRTDGSIASTNVPYVSGRDSYTFTISNLVPDSSYTIFSSCSDGLVFTGNRVVSAIGVGAQLVVNTLSISTAVTTSAPTTTVAPSGGVASTPYAGITRTQLMNAIYALTFFRYCDPTGGPYWLNEMVNTGDLVLVGTDGFDIRNDATGIERVVSTIISSVSANHNELYTMLPVNTIVGGALSSASQYPNRYTPQFVLGTPISSATKFMNAIYKYSLGRLADRAGAMYWVGEMISMGYITVSSTDMMTVNNLNGIESTVRSMIGGVQAPDVYTSSPVSSIVGRALSNYNDGTFFPSVYTL